MSDLVKVAAILGLVVLEVKALSIGYDGTLFSLVVAAVAGLAGYEMGKRA